MLAFEETTAGVVDVSALIDRGPFSPFQRRVVLLCALLYLLDGYDTLAIGYTAPLLAGVVHVPMSAFGAVFSTGILGATVGTLCFGVLGDRIGRRWAMIAACVIFAVFSLATLWVSTLPQLLALRFLTGLGLGGATPLFVTMATEYAPARLRGLAMAVVYAAFPLGGVLGGVVSSMLIPRYGWQSVFAIGGLAPLAVAGLLIAFLPESLRFMLARGERRDGGRAGAQAAVRRILARMGGIASETRLVPGASETRVVAGASKTRLVAGGEPVPEGRGGLAAVAGELGARRTACLWVMFFCVFMVIMTVSTWTPGLLRGAGVPLATASLILAANSFGAMIGTLGAGHLFDRFGASRILLPQLVLSALSVGLFGFASGSTLLLGVVATLAGVFVSGASACLFALAGGLYPTAMRSSGVGLAMGCGRVGQVLGPLGIGLLLGHQVGLNTIFLLASVPCMAAAVAAIAFSSSSPKARPSPVADFSTTM